MCSLIASPRFRPGDLEHWRSHELADKLYAMRQSQRLKRLEEEAKGAIARFLEDSPAYCSISWGKDSTVTAYLAFQVSPKIPLVSIRSNRSNPDDLAVRDDFLSRFPMQYDGIGIELDNDDLGERASEVAAFFRPAQAKYGDRRIIGIRADESAARRMQLFQHGHNTVNVCRPIIRWKMQDVFAYMQTNDLPIHPVYAMSNAGMFTREQLRVDVLGDRKGTQFSRRQWEELYYRDVLWKSSTT